MNRLIRVDQTSQVGSVVHCWLFNFHVDNVHKHAALINETFNHLCSRLVYVFQYFDRMCSILCQWRRQPQKVGGPNHVSLLVSSKSNNIHTWGTPPYVKKTFQRICANPKRGLNRSGGVRIPPVATPLYCVDLKPTIYFSFY